MSPERWRKIEEVFQTVVECAPHERKDYLTQICAGDDELRGEVESLLAHEAAATQLAAPIKGTVQMLARDSEQDLIGLHLGPYRVTELLGIGGMGAVYRAIRDDAEFQQQVAIKVVRRGMDSRFILNRFRHERQILASLDHPNIARLLDGGTTADGLPYFVMEHIAGQPLTEYCTARQLSSTERVKLFRQVCSAVQYAHQKLVVHRDLKPGNVLVNETGVPKLLDFGIAKLLDNSQEGGAQTQTATQMRMLTPDYASPEQVRGLQITTASDIYSLGAVLYELLTGARPHRLESYMQAELERVICEAEVVRPSEAINRGAMQATQLRKQLAGDLDNIILMALRKEPERRYQSVQQLADDLQRYLEGRPVSARSDTLRYRTGKFVRRHKFGVLAALLIILSLAGGLLAANYQARRAERRFQQVRKLANTFLFDFHNKIEKLPGATEARELVITTALEYLDNLAQEAKNDAELQLELAQAYLKVGDLQGNPWAANLGHSTAATQSYRKAIALAEQIAVELKENTNAGHAALRVAAVAHTKLGILQAEAGSKQDGLAKMRQGLSLAERLHQQTGQAEDLKLVETIHGHIGDTRLDMGEINEALNSYLRSLETAQREAAQFPSDEAQVTLARQYGRVGEARTAVGELTAALESFQQSAEIQKKLLERQPHNLLLRRGLRASYSWTGSVYGHPYYVNLENRAAAMEYSEKALDLAKTLVAMDRQNALLQSDLILAYARLGDVLADAAPARALELYRKGVAVAEAAVQAKLLPEFKFKLYRGIAQTRLAAQLCRLNQCRAALPKLAQARDTLQALAMQDPSNLQLQADWRATLFAQANACLTLADWHNALFYFRAAATVAEKLAAASAQDVNPRWWLIQSYEGLGRYHMKLGAAPGLARTARLEHWRTARQWQQQVLARWDDWPPHGGLSTFTKLQREQAARALAECDAAIAQLTAANH